MIYKWQSQRKRQRRIVWSPCKRNWVCKLGLHTLPINEFYNLTIITMVYKLEKGQRFWRLTLMGECKHQPWGIIERCLCDCGNEKRVKHSCLIRWAIMSCWCLLKDTAREKQKKNCTKHWLWKWKNRFSRIYQWMRRRCKNHNDKAYPQYWGRGIKISWNSIEEFYNDMYSSYKEHCDRFWEKNTTIDRIDIDGDYCKENCRWATAEEQNNNRRDNSYVEIDGVRYNTHEYAKKFNVKYDTAKYRMREYRKWKLSYETLIHVWVCV